MCRHHPREINGFLTVSGTAVQVVAFIAQTNGLHFLNSQFPTLHADMFLALMQPLLRVSVSRQVA